MNPVKMTNKTRNIERRLGAFMARHGFALGSHDAGGMGEWYVTIENSKFTIMISHDRGGLESVEIGAKKRLRPKAQMNQWSLSHLRGFLEGSKDHYIFKNIDEQYAWLEENENKLLDPALLNSEEMKNGL